MSCDGNRGKFFGHAAHHKAVQDTFGSPAEAEAALEQIFNTARSGAIPRDTLQQKKAEARTKKLFEEMRQGGLKPPTHSANGLPRRDAQFGYAAVQQTLDAVRSGKPLPALARSILDQKQRTRHLSAVKEDAGRVLPLRELRAFRIARTRACLPGHGQQRNPGCPFAAPPGDRGGCIRCGSGRTAG